MYLHQTISSVIGARTQAVSRRRTGSEAMRGRPVRFSNPVTGLMVFLAPPVAQRGIPMSNTMSASLSEISTPAEARVAIRAANRLLGGDFSLAEARQYAPQIAECERLDALANGFVEVQFWLKPIFSEDHGIPDGQFVPHVYTCATGEEVHDQIHLDTRKPDSLERQLLAEFTRVADECERVGRLHREAAARLAAKIA